MRLLGWEWEVAHSGSGCVGAVSEAVLRDVFALRGFGRRAGLSSFPAREERKYYALSDLFKGCKKIFDSLQENSGRFA
jgi:hypothetical protein